MVVMERGGLGIEPCFSEPALYTPSMQMTVCKLAAYLENDSDHEIPKQLNLCEVLG